MALKSKRGMSLFGRMVSSVERTAKSISREHTAEKQRQERELQKQAKERQKADFEAKGFKRVSISSLDKYMAFLPLDFFEFLNSEISNGRKSVFVHQSKLDEFAEQLRASKVQQRKLQQCTERNNKGRAYEKEGEIASAIRIYEQNIVEGCYPAHHSFKRLMMLYRKAKDYENENRVIMRALEVFPNHEEYLDRLVKNKSLGNK